MNDMTKTANDTMKDAIHFTKEEWEKLQNFFASQKLESDTDSMKKYFIEKFHLAKDTAFDIANAAKDKAQSSGVVKTAHDAMDYVIRFTKEEWEKLQHFFTSQKLDSDAESMKEYLMKKFNLTKDVATNIAQDLKKKMNE